MSNIEYLLLKHTKTGHWTPPKGHNDSNESDFDAAVRETREESGLNLDTDYKIVDGFRAEAKYPVKKGEKTVVYFLAELTNKNSVAKLSHEHTDFAWLHLEAACQRLNEDQLTTREVLRKAAVFLAKLGKYS